MAQVPYNPVPQVAPIERPNLPSVSVDTPLAAFGGAVAGAVSGLGRDISGTGNELFHRAIAMQTLQNETDAKNADIDFMAAANEVHARFNELQGSDRVNAYPKYQSDLKEIYQKHRGSLSNPMAQRMFDSAAVSTLSRSMFNGAGAAATAQREASLSAADAEFDINSKQVFNNPDDNGQFEEAIDRNDKAAAKKAALSPGGWSQEREDDLKQKGRSTLAYNRIIGMARYQPYKASQLLKEYQDRGLLFGAQAESAIAKVQSFSHTTGMATVADQVLGKNRQDDGTFKKTFQDMQQEAKDLATKMYPDDPGIGAAAASALDRNFNQLKFGQRQDQYDVQGKLNDFIVKGIDKVDMLPPDIVNRMTPAQVKAFPGQANAYRQSLDKQTNEASYNKLLGLYNNDNAAFMDKDIYKEPGLSRSNIDFFVGLQRKAQAGGDPRVDRAINWIRGAKAMQLNELDLHSRTTRNADDYDQYVGALHESIQAYQEATGKAPDQKAIVDQIFPSVIQQVVSRGWIWNSKVPFFKSTIPDDAKAAAEKDAGKELSDAEVRQFYDRLYFQQFFGQKSTKTQDRVQ